MIRKAALVLCHSVVLMLLHLVYFNQHWSLPLEYEVMMMLNKTESYIAGQGRFNEQDYLFVNTTYDQEQITIETEFGDAGSIAITDRQMLAQFFERISFFGNRHRFILCDILFEHNSPNDSVLKERLSAVHKIIAPRDKESTGKDYKKLVVDVVSAPAEYITFEGLVSKIRLYSAKDRLKMLPLVMYEEVNDLRVHAGRLGLAYKGNNIPWSVYPRYFFNTETLKRREIRLKQLVDVLGMGDSSFYEKVLLDKIIILGDFNKDRHYTFVGRMPGSLVLVNSYLTLEAGLHQLGWGWFLFSIAAFALLVYFELFDKKEKAYLKSRSWRKLFIHLLGLSGKCLLISLISGLLFGVHITIIPVIVYLELLRNFKKIWTHKLNK